MPPPPPPPRVRKRQRPPAAVADDPLHTDEDVRASDDLTPRPGQAERKRELERNRRNLVNVRFVELEAELRRCIPRPDPSSTDNGASALAKGKRIDKEAVLKDAAQRLAVQRKDLSVAGERMAAMSAEIQNLRAEKVELRADKNYLRSELETVRGDVKHLRSDNINLWQAFKKASTFKDAFAQDVAKIPAEIFMRSPPEQLTGAATVANGLVQQVASMHAMPTAHQQTTAPTALPNAVVPPQAITEPPPQPQQQLGQQHQQAEHRSQQQQDGQAAQRDGQAAQRLVRTSSPMVSDSQSREVQTPALQAHGPSQEQNEPVQSDSFLILQSPEELGEFFSTYVPGAMGANFQNATSTQSEPIQNSNNQRFAAMVGLSPTNAPPTPALNQTQLQQETAPTSKGDTGSQQNPFNLVVDETGSSSPKLEKDEEPVSSDVAYCV